MLATNADEFASRHAIEGVKNLRNERPQFLDTISLGEHDDHADTGRAEVLLKLEILVDGEQSCKVFREHQPQQLAISLRGPPHVDYMADVVSNQVLLKWTRDALIEQEQHGLRSSHGQVRAPRPPALG